MTQLDPNHALSGRHDASGWTYPNGGTYPNDSFTPSGSSGYPPPERRFGVGAVLGLLLVIALLIAGLGTGAYFLLRPAASPSASSPSAAPVPAAVSPTLPAAPPAPAAPAAPVAPAAPSNASGSTTSLSQVFPASTGTGCTAYTPAAGEYVTSSGRQASEVRACASGASNGDGVVYTRWPAAADAASVVSDQAQATNSVNGKTTWTMGGTTEGDYHEARQSDGSCRAFLDYTSSPYAVVFSAPTCSGVEQLFQQTTLPDAATLPR